MIAGVYHVNEIASWTEDQKARHIIKIQEHLNLDTFGVVGVVDRPPSQQVLSTRSKNSGWTDVARGFGPDFYAGTSKLSTLRALFTTAAIDGNPVAFADCHSASHQSQMPSESAPTSVSTETQCLKHRWTLPKLGSARRLFQGLKMPPQACSQHKENQRHGL